MSTLQESLGDGETIVTEAHAPWTTSALAWAALIFLGIFVIGSIIFIVMMVKRWTTRIGVTNQRFMQKTGLIRRRTQEIALADIESMEVSQSALGRTFDYGKVRIARSGADMVATPNIADPFGFVQAIETAKKQAA